MEWKILIFVRSEMKFDLHIGLKTKNAICAFLHLASTSSSVPTVVVIKLPRYVKAYTCSRTSLTQLMLSVFAGDRILISSGLDALILRPTLAACPTSAANFCLMWVIFRLSKTISSTKFKSTNFSDRANWIPVLLSPKACQETQSSAIRKRKGLRKHPWRTTVFMLKDPVISPSCKTLAWKS